MVKNHLPVGVWWGLLRIPKPGVRELLVEPTFRLRLIVNAVEADDTLQEDMELRVGRRILRNLEERKENIFLG